MSVEGEVRTALPTGVVTLLLTDVEDSTRLWERVPAAMAAAIPRQYAILDGVIAAHGGVRPLEQGEGDSVVAAFVRPADALSAALDAQLAFRAEAWPDGAELRVRMAVHTGDVHLRDPSNYAGSTIIRCARLRALAAGGQIVVSGTTRELTRDALPAGSTFADLGERRLKGIERPEQVFGLLHPDLGGGWELQAPPENLPRSLTPFVGREDERRSLSAALEGSRIVTLTGPGGAGKTRLAVRVARDRLSRYPDGAFFVDLARIDRDDLVARAFLDALHLPEQTTRPALDTVLEHVRRRTCLLVVDNCEHVVHGAAAVIDALLHGSDHLVVAATSREPLGIDGERVWAVEGLTVDGDGADAIALFSDRAVRARTAFVLDDAAAPLVRQICAALDGMPLAIELAAARLRQLSLVDVAEGLSSSLRLLDQGPRTSDDRQRTLRGSLQWSHDLLDERERLLYARFGVFDGGADRDTVGAVCADDGLDPHEVLDVLASLVDKSLIRLTDGPSGSRYRMLEPVRQHALERLGDDHAVRDRHLALFARRAADAAAQDRWDAVAPFFELESANLRAAVQHALPSQPTVALALAAAMRRSWIWGGRMREGLELCRRVLAAAPEPTADRAMVLSAGATLSQFLGDMEGALALAGEALGCAQATDDPLARGVAGHALTAIIGPAEPRMALEMSEAAIEDLRNAGSPLDLAWALVGHAINLSWQDRFTAAAEAVREAQSLTPDRAIAAWATIVEVWALIPRGRLEDALAAARKGRALAGRTVPMVDDILGQQILSAHVWAGRAETVLADADRAVASTQQESPLASSALASVLVVAELACGNTDAVVSRAEPLAGHPLRYHVAEATSAGGLAALVDRRPDEARRCAAEVRAIAAAIGNDRFAAFADLIDGRAALDDGALETSRGLLHRVLAAWSPDVSVLLVPSALEALGAVAVAEEDWPVAARLLAASSASRAELGIVRIPEDPERWAPLHDVAERHAPDAYVQGAEMTVAEAVAYASRGRGPRERPLKGWDALTPTERQVADLASAGRTNPEIAETLFMSRATVKRHLARAFEKLGVANRTELAAHAARRATPSA